MSVWSDVAEHCQTQKSRTTCHPMAEVEASNAYRLIRHPHGETPEEVSTHDENDGDGKQENGDARQ